jgi:nitroimidazol reductase NimA-like FMN-containing flavoprotein (pyridoxamine 5'-phosphate oxidase superfamily)
MPRLDLSLSEHELEDFLGVQRTVRLATASPTGLPQVVPLWYVWLDGTMYLNTTLGNLTVRNLDSGGRATALVDDGTEYEELRGVVLRGPVERADQDPNIPQVKQSWSGKYMGGKPVPYDRWKNRVWLRLRPVAITSWDFRKIPDARARAARER